MFWMGKTRKEEGHWGKRPTYKRDKKHKVGQVSKPKPERSSLREEEFWESLYIKEGDENFEKFSNRRK